MTWLLLLLALGLAFAVAIETWLVVHLRRQSSELDERVDRLQRELAREKRIAQLREAGAVSFSLPAESILNDFELPDLIGRKRTFSSMRGARIAAIFVQPSCAASQRVIAAVKARPIGEWQLLFISTGAIDANRSLFDGLPEDASVVLQEEFELARVWRVMKTPSAYLIDAGGVTVGPLREGGDAVLAALGIDDVARADVDSAQTTPFAPTVFRVPGPPAVGAYVPDLHLTLLSGRTAPLQSVRTTVLMLLDLGCAPCRDGVPALAAAIRARAARTRILIMSFGDRATAEELTAMLGPMVGVSPQPDYRIMKQMGMTQAPSAIAFDRFGAVLSEVAVGGAAIEALLASVELPA